MLKSNPFATDLFTNWSGRLENPTVPFNSMLRPSVPCKHGSPAKRLAQITLKSTNSPVSLPLALRRSYRLSTRTRHYTIETLQPGFYVTVYGVKYLYFRTEFIKMQQEQQQEQRVAVEDLFVSAVSMVCIVLLY